MYIVLSNIPPGTRKKNIQSFIEHYGDMKAVRFLGSKKSNSVYCLIDVGEGSRVVASAFAARLNHVFWNSRTLSAHCPLFQ